MKIPLPLKDLAFIGFPPVIVLMLHMMRIFALPLYSALDPLAHFLGGVAIAWSSLNAYLVLRSRKMLPALPLWFIAFVMIAATALIGVFWELYEYVYFHRSTFAREFAWWSDTINDFIMDLSGGLIFCIIARAKMKE